jgi:D-aminopeptidase
MGGGVRLADWSITIGALPRGRTNSVLDVPGVGLGHATVISDQAEPPAGTSIARTGVTVLDPGDPWASPVPAGVSILNGAGELTGRTQIDEWGLAETPVFLTSTMQVGRVYDAACRLLIDGQPRIGVDDVVIPIVGECDDSWLTDARRMHVRYDDVASALAAARHSVGGSVASGDLGLGAVGAGTGMSCFSWKGGIGSASRLLEDGHVVGVLVLANFGWVESAHDRRSGGGPRPGSAASHRTAARRVVSWRGHHRRADRRREMRSPCGADGPRAGPHRIDGPSWVR